MVVGIEAALNGVSSAIIDISRSGVRLVRPAGFPTDGVVTIDFALAPCGRSKKRCFRVEGRLVRATAIDVTYTYDPPLRQWAAMLRARDTFMQTALIRM